MQKKFFAVATFALAFAVAFSASAYDLGSTTLKRGSSGAAVVELQKALNACNAAGLTTDGAFGRGTESAAKAFQASKSLTADGYVGAMTKAALNSCGSTTPAPSTAGLCPNGMTLASNCTAAPSSSSNWGSSSAEGYLSTIEADSANRVGLVYESESDKVVDGFRATAKLSDQKIEKVTVIFKQTDTTGPASANLGNYISSVSLWNGSSKIATASVSDADRSTVDDTYTFNFTGLNAVISKDMVGRFYVSINVNGSLDSANTANAQWFVNVTDIRSTSPNGVYNNYAPINLGVGAIGNDLGGLTFAKFSASGVKAAVSLAQSSPLAYTKEVSKTTPTNGVKLLDFNVKAEVSPVTLRNLPVTISSSAIANTFINTVKLVNADGMTVADFAPSTGSTYVLSNLASQYATVAAGTTAKYSIIADFKQQGATYGNYADGVTVSAKITSVAAGTWSVIDSNGDQLVTRTGGAAGYTITLRSAGATVTYVTEGYTPAVTGTSTADGLISLTMDVTAFGGPLTLNDNGSDTTFGTFNATSAGTKVEIAGLTAVGTGPGVFTIEEGSTQRVTVSKLFNTKSGFLTLSVTSLNGVSVPSTIKTGSH